jgi:hypothetical protein
MFKRGLRLYVLEKDKVIKLKRVLSYIIVVKIKRISN